MEATEEGRDWSGCSRVTGDPEVVEVFAVLKARGGVEDRELDALCKAFAVFRGVEGITDRETGKTFFRVARRGSGLIGRSTVASSSSASSSELIVSLAIPWSFSSATSASQSLSRFLALDRPASSDSVVGLGLYFGKAEGGTPGLGCKAEDRRRNDNEARDLDGFSTAFFGDFSPT